ncbi:MAG TPA: tripartite tricarboxylate transporter substrate binding protein [Burkholderiales bacterium]|nr:tripartite tricarboxylate transporter substrate binding protein [Burkholderiales bacterium]
MPKSPIFMLAAVAAVYCGAAPAQQAYPVKPIRMIVPTAPGGGTDLLARVLAQKLTENLGQQVIVDNRGGGGTTIGAAAAAKSPPDGYTILVHHISLGFNQSFYRSLSYHALRDFAPISLLAAQPYLVVVHPSLPVRSMKELVALAKARPGEITYASGGAGSGPFIATELLKQVAQVNLLHVPYRGSGPALADVAGGHAQLMVATMSLSYPQVKAGRVRALAVTSPERARAAPQIPTVAESGLPTYQFIGWYGLLAPAGTPQSIVARLNQEVATIMKADDVAAKIAADGLDAMTSTPAEFAAYLKSEVQRWAKVVKAIGIYAD